MKKKKEDRRVLKTKKQASEALISLILEKGFEEITVQDILDRANMGRSTFYSHFRDKDALLLAGFQLLQKMLEEKHLQMKSSKSEGQLIEFDISLELFLHAQSHLKLYKAMVGKHSGQLIIKYMHSLLQVQLKKYISEVISDKKLASNVDLISTWTVSAFLSVLVWWLDRNCPISAVEIDAQFKQLTKPGLKAFLPELKFL